MMTQLVETARLPEGERIAQERAIDAEMKGKKPSGAMWLLLTPASLKVAEACRRKSEQVRTLMLIVAVERYRLKHKKWPGSLDDLKPGLLKAIPLDPYDGKPLRYKKQ